MFTVHSGTIAYSGVAQYEFSVYAYIVLYHCYFLSYSDVTECRMVLKHVETLHNVEYALDLYVSVISLSICPS